MKSCATLQCARFFFSFFFSFSSLPLWARCPLNYATRSITLFSSPLLHRPPPPCPPPLLSFTFPPVLPRVPPSSLATHRFSPSLPLCSPGCSGQTPCIPETASSKNVHIVPSLFGSWSVRPRVVPQQSAEHRTAPPRLLSRLHYRVPTHHAVALEPAQLAAPAPLAVAAADSPAPADDDGGSVACFTASAKSSKAVFSMRAERRRSRIWT